MPNTPKGWLVWTGDGGVYSSSELAWEDVPATDVQVVAQFFHETYLTYVQRHDERGQVVHSRLERLNYVQHLYAQDYYWLDAESGLLAGGPASEAPADAPPGTVKRGRTMDDEAWYDLYNRAMLVQTF